MKKAVARVFYVLAWSAAVVAVVAGILTGELRDGCKRSSENNTGLVLALRADIVGNHAVGSDPGQPQRTRNARNAEVVIQRESIAVYDAHIDARYAKVLRDNDPVDYRIVRAGGFSCSRAYPGPAL